MKLRSVMILAGLVLGSGLAMRQATASSPEEFPQANCVMTVPSSWGEFKGATREFGMVFEDRAGNLRFIGDVGCQISGTQPTPIVSLEVRRR